MLYTIVSRIPVFVNDKSSRKYAKIFMIGAICYIIIHYLLFSFCKGELANKLKNYIYYIIIVDAGIAYLLDKVLSVTDNDDKSPFVKKSSKSTEESEHKCKVEEIKDEKKEQKNSECKNDKCKSSECKNGTCKNGTCKLPEKKKQKTTEIETSEESSKKKTETEKDTEIPSYHV